MSKEVDGRWLQDLLVEFLRTPTEVSPGETEVMPADPKILKAVDEVLLPAIHSMGPEEIRRHPLGDICARFGPPEGEGILLLTYVVSQHANFMEEPHSGRAVDGAELGLKGVAHIGQGATQNKGALAAAFAAARALPNSLRKPVWLAVNTEGQSSHGGSTRIIEDLDISAAAGILLIGTDHQVSIGNRGRVDVDVFVKGKSAHSSQPWLGANPVEGLAEVVRLLRDLPLPQEHPGFGKAAVTPYQVGCYPVAPHTLPEECHIVLDRRLLPGESPNDAVADIRRHLNSLPRKNLSITVEAGKWMLPAVIDAEEPVVRVLTEAIEAVRGRPAELIVSRNTFDAGYACHKGIPTPMYGPGKRHFSGEKMMGVDAVSLQDCFDCAAILLRTLRRLCA